MSLKKDLHGKVGAVQYSTVIDGIFLIAFKYLGLVV